MAKQYVDVIGHVDSTKEGGWKCKGIKFLYPINSNVYKFKIFHVIAMESIKKISIGYIQKKMRWANFIMTTTTTKFDETKRKATREKEEKVMRQYKLLTKWQ